MTRLTKALVGACLAGSVTILAGNAQAMPTFPGRNRHVAFDRSIGDIGPNIWRVDHDGSQQRQLTTRTTSGLMNPQFSPNGRKIVAFGGARTDHVWTMRTDGSHKRKLS
jgi:Tol biopolymer transport system component